MLLEEYDMRFFGNLHNNFESYITTENFLQFMIWFQKINFTIKKWIPREVDGKI